MRNSPVTLGSAPDDPTGGLDLDDPETLATLEARIVASGVRLVIIDTVGMVTGRNLCRPEEARAFFAPIIELAAKTGVAFLGLTHLSKDGGALGRRIVEKARVVMKMTCPDPEGQRNRRRFWIDKTAVQRPAPLGITMGSAGNEYDPNPPTDPVPEIRKPGPVPAKLDACKNWLRAQLTPNPARVSVLRTAGGKEGYSSGTIYDAMKSLGVEEIELESYKWWKMPEKRQAEDKDREEAAA